MNQLHHEEFQAIVHQIVELEDELRCGVADEMRLLKRKVLLRLQHQLRIFWPIVPSRGEPVE
jgi:hypothetical protein